MGRNLKFRTSGGQLTHIIARWVLMGSKNQIIYKFDWKKNMDLVTFLQVTLKEKEYVTTCVGALF